MVKKYFSLFSLITALVILFDQLLKYVIRKTVTQAIQLTSFFSISNIQNTGAGFGLFHGQRLLLIIISFLVVFFISIYYKKIEQEWIPQTLWALIFGGAIGNLIDRLFFGYVTDFIHLSFWPAFNIADMCISVGVVGAIVYYMKK